MDHALIVVIDGLGVLNLEARLGHAPTLRRLSRERLETVAPSTTGAAITTLTTGTLPGTHGLIGYRIWDPQHRRLRVTLRDWADDDSEADRRRWQRRRTVFEQARDAGGINVSVVSRPAHRDSGFTTSVLTGAQYRSGQRILDRAAAALTEMMRANEAGRRSLTYLYIDELDRAGHAHGWQSDDWVECLERADAALDRLFASLPPRVGVVVTADHGMVDAPATDQVLLDHHSAGEENPALAHLLATQVREYGGEPRFRALYLHDPSHAESLSALLQEAEGEHAWVGTRDEWVSHGVFGEVDPEVVPRLGDVMIAARGARTYYASTDDPQSRFMVGQHGSFTAAERTVPLLTGGVWAGETFAQALGQRVG